MADEGDRVIRIVVEPSTIEDRNVLRNDSEVQVFYHRDLGWFWSYRADLRDLAGVYLDAAHECYRAKGPIV